ncbi:unnamed protein product [Rhodiola kirilowii]
MPGMTGYDLLKKIKESSLLKNIPVVIMSSENVSIQNYKMLRGRRRGVLLKPMKLSDVNKLKPHMMKSMIRKNDQSQEAESNNTAIQPQSQPQLHKEEQQHHLKKRKLAVEEDEIFIQ